MIAELIITVGSLEEAVTFYTETVGLGYLRRMRVDDETVVLLDADGTRIALVQGPRPGIRVALSTEDVGAASRRLDRRGVTLPVQPTRAKGGTVLPFADPWGNDLAFWETS